MTAIAQPATSSSATHLVPFARTLVSDEAREAAARVLASGWLTTGPETVAFEEDFAEWVGAEHAVAVSSCTAALELALRGLRLPRGSRVLVSTMTFCGAVHAIVHAGHVPVLLDVDPVTGMPTTETVARAVLHEPAAAMVVVHLAGLPADVEALADAAGLPLAHVIEDAAHALGTAVGDREVGTISRATCFSFYATKNLPIGEGGMVTTDDDQLAARIRRTRLHGMSADAWRRYLPGGSWAYTVDEAGLKANMGDVQAAIGRAQLRHLPAWQRRRAEIADHYTRRLASVPGLAPPPRPHRGRHAWHLYVVRVNAAFGRSRDEVAVLLAEAGIGTSVHFIPLHTMRYFRKVAEVAASYPGADVLFPRVLSLPMHPALADDDVDRVCDALIALRRAGLPAQRPAALNLRPARPPFEGV